MVQRRTDADSPPRDAGKAPGHTPFLRQRVGTDAPKRRSSEGASTGRSAKSTAGGAAGQLTEKD
ncbi:hypothetical protein H6CHR_00439 [Variovorax sp. PBL-H6]|uniref:hypothetical protein n=1 Tax=Variovorax sp. PBL-H6 TaxID=434009 RepID=UPI001316F7A9|nr:hypothetical protein [Variovorax sp. PBL-H6]VTU16113.1 hypothetical protein H6CHR_00439 [Variovorax sp. PBL-H6]